MAVEVMIRKEGKGDDLLLKSFIGEDLVIGTYDDTWRFEVGKTGQDMGIIDPSNPGRAIMVHLDPEDKTVVKLKLPIPTAPHDVEVFVDVVSRVAKEWGGTIWTSANDSMPAGVFAANLNSIREFNLNTIKEVSNNLISGKAPSFGVFGANWPVYMGVEEAKVFVKHPERFGDWLKEKQSVDAYFATPHFYKGDDGIFGVYFLTSECRSIFPTKASVPYGFNIECNDFRVALGIEGERIGEVSYEQLMERLPKEKLSKYDENCVIIDDLSNDEIKAIL